MIRANEFVEMLNSLLEVGHPVNMDKLSLLFSNNYNNKGNSNGRNNVNQSNKQEQGSDNKIIRKNKVHIDFFFLLLWDVLDIKKFGYIEKWCWAWPIFIKMYLWEKRYNCREKKID